MDSKKGGKKIIYSIAELNELKKLFQITAAKNKFK